ncbi:hypothetical protein CLU83_1538 [Flavobacterium sp. 1]|nr:hypothetical protein [Flavobacterium sp. 1]PJJ08281.1 hypothetical protein CLU83_1538 [Flavobacterium sp. 1]
MQTAGLIKVGIVSYWLKVIWTVAKNANYLLLVLIEAASPDLEKQGLLL